MSRGALVVVATPIGNFGDLSPRAVEALAGVDVIACEDTRHTRKLLSHAGVTGADLLAVHDRNEAAQVRHVLGLVEHGRRVAVVTDAGTPGIADPGQRLVAAVAAAGLPVEVVPGPSALIAALVASGLPTHRFCFEGFLARKGSERSARLRAVAAARVTTILYEAPHRMRRTVADLAEVCVPWRRVVVARELTKLHEEVWRGTLEGAAEHLGRTEPRGEYVIVLDGAPPPPPPTENDIRRDVQQHLDAGADRRAAVAAVAAHLDVPRRRVYGIAVGMRASS